MKLKFILHRLLVLALLALTPAAFPQNGGTFNLNWTTLDSAGGTCAGGVFALTGTIGQPDAAPGHGGSFTLAGGFWPGVATEVGPTLHITSAGGNVIISWPASATGFHLQHCTDLGRLNWVSNTTPSIPFGPDRVVVEQSSGIRFYRLRK